MHGVLTLPGFLLQYLSEEVCRVEEAGQPDGYFILSEKDLIWVGQDLTHVGHSLDKITQVIGEGLTCWVGFLEPRKRGLVYKNTFENFFWHVVEDSFAVNALFEVLYFIFDSFDQCIVASDFAVHHYRYTVLSSYLEMLL